jgi:hypothetical protein
MIIIDATPTFAADNPHFTIRFLNFAIIDSFLHFLTVPDKTSSSERAVVDLDTSG